MIVEDLKLHQQKIKDAISELGYKVSGVFAYGEKAVDYILTGGNQPDLIIIDIVLIGKMNGYQVANKISSETNIPFIIISGESDEIKEFEASVYLKKPFDKQELKNNIELALYKYEIYKKLLKSNEEQEMILETIDTQIWYLNDAETYGIANQAHANFIGKEKKEIKNKKIDKILSKKEAEICTVGNKIVFEEKNKIQTEEWLKDSEGEKRLLAITKNPKLNKEGEVEYVVCSAEDITERKKRIEELDFQHQFQKTLAEISSAFINTATNNIDDTIKFSLKTIGNFFDIDHGYIFEIDNEEKRMSNTYEWTAENIVAKKDKLQNISVNLFSNWIKKLDKKEFIIIDNIEKINGINVKEKRLLKEQNIKSMVMIPIHVENELFGFYRFDFTKKYRKFNEEEINMLKLFTDVITNAFSRYLDEKRIRELTYYDTLTGIYNRRFFEEEIKRLDTKRQLPLSIIMADVNGLKIINDSYGHEKGDQLLKKAAEILKKSVREEDILARQGGDEFAVLLPNTGREQASKVMSRFKEKIIKTNNEEIPISIALGSATKKDSEQEITEVLKKADDNMYQNKLSESRSSKSKIVNNLLSALDAKSQETKEHAVRMTKLAFDFGEQLELSNSALNRLSLLATLHDIGKTNISAEILNKPGKLSQKEWEIAKKHSEHGYKIAAASDEFAVVANEIFAHHENWDGSGYPQNLKGKKIPYLARIISIIDAYDVMIHDRPYSKAISKAEALAEIKKCAGSQFDPELALKFIEMMKSD